MEKREGTPRLDAMRRSVARAQAEKLKRVGAEFRGLAMPPLKECDNPDCMDVDCARHQARQARDVPPGPAPLATITIRNATLTGRAYRLAMELRTEVSLQGPTAMSFADYVELPDDGAPLVEGGVSHSTLDTLWAVVGVGCLVALVVGLIVLGALIEGGRP